MSLRTLRQFANDFCSSLSPLPFYQTLLSTQSKCNEKAKRFGSCPLIVLPTVFVCQVAKLFFLVTLIISSNLEIKCIGLLCLFYSGLLICFSVLLLVFLFLFYAPTRHKTVEFIYIYIYICILHNYKLILLVAPHKKDLLKLYLLLNYSISDNHRVGQGKIKKK